MNVMAPEKLLAILKRKLGVSIIKLPLDDKELMEILKDETLITFSTYFSNYAIVLMDLNDSLVPGTDNTYFIDTEQFGNDIAILGVQKLKNYNRNRLDTGLMTAMGIEDLAMLQVDSNFASMFETGNTFEFIPPNKVKFSSDFGDYYGKLRMEVRITHAPNFSTISPTKRDEFLKLALLDLKLNLYEVMKHFNDIETTFGTINLKIDEWQNANDERKSLLEKWDSIYLNDAKDTIYVV